MVHQKRSATTEIPGDEISNNDRRKRIHGEENIDPSNDESLEISHNVTEKLTDFELVQEYSRIEHELPVDRVQISRSGDINIAAKKLKSTEKLFKNIQSDSSASSNNQSALRNRLTAKDSKILMNITELANISVKTIKINGGKKTITLNDMTNGMKKFMLKDYFKQQNMSEYLVDYQSNNANTSKDKDSNNTDKFSSFNDFLPFNWFKLGGLYNKYSGNVLLNDHLYGPLSTEKKVRAQTQRRTNTDTVGEARTAQLMTNETLADGKQEQGTPREVKRCFARLSKVSGGERVNLFIFIIDPKSYAKSVENLFYTSFLIHEKKIVMEENEDDPNIPYIRLLSPLPTNEDERLIEIKRRQDAQQNHIIFHLDIPTWKKLIERYNITKPYGT